MVSMQKKARLIHERKSKNSGRRRLTDTAVWQILRAIEEKEPYSSIARRFEVHKSLIGHIAVGRRKPPGSAETRKAPPTADDRMAEGAAALAKVWGR